MQYSIEIVLYFHAVLCNNSYLLWYIQNNLLTVRCNQQNFKRERILFFSNDISTNSFHWQQLSQILMFWTFTVDCIQSVNSLLQNVPHVHHCNTFSVAFF